MVSKVTIRSQLIAVSSIERSELYFYDDSAENSDEHYIDRLTIRKHELAGPIIVLRNVSQLTALTVTDETIQNGETKLSSWCNTDGLSYVMLLYRKFRVFPESGQLHAVVHSHGEHVPANVRSGIPAE